MYRTVLILGLVLLLGACATTTKESASEGTSGTPAPMQPGDQEGTGASAMAPANVEAQGTGRIEPVEVHPLDDPASLLAVRTIHFDFDSSRIRDEYRDNILAHGAYLADHPAAAVTLEGHADERGTRAYNMALGERRANAVRDLLLLNGAASSQIRVVSYGEERPVDPGHNEAAWAKNRRVEIIYRHR